MSTVLWISGSNVNDVCTRDFLHPSFGYNFTKVNFNNFPIFIFNKFMIMISCIFLFF
jgi:hypothetical protein